MTVQAIPTVHDLKCCGNCSYYIRLTRNVCSKKSIKTKAKFVCSEWSWDFINSRYREHVSEENERNQTKLSIEKK